VFTQQFSLVALSFPPSLLSLVSVCITTAKTFLLVLSVLLGLCLYFSISFDRFPASSMAAHVFGLEILLAPVLAPFSLMLIFLRPPSYQSSSLCQVLFWCCQSHFKAHSRSIFHAGLILAFGPQSATGTCS
jgi:hypothetical protein